MITNFDFVSAKIDERLVAPDMLDNIKGLLGADMDHISSDLSEYCFKRCIDLQTPLIKSMPDNQPISVINRLKNARGDIEMVIGQLSGRFNLICKRLEPEIYGICLTDLCVKYWLITSAL